MLTFTPSQHDKRLVRAWRDEGSLAGQLVAEIRFDGVLFHTQRISSADLRLIADHMDELALIAAKESH